MNKICFRYTLVTLSSTILLPSINNMYLHIFLGIFASLTLIKAVDTYKDKK